MLIVQNFRLMNILRNQNCWTVLVCSSCSNQILTSWDFWALDSGWSNPSTPSWKTLSFENSLKELYFLLNRIWFLTSRIVHCLHAVRSRGKHGTETVSRKIVSPGDRFPQCLAWFRDFRISVQVRDFRILKSVPVSVPGTLSRMPTPGSKTRCSSSISWFRFFSRDLLAASLFRRRFSLKIKFC